MKTVVFMYVPYPMEFDFATEYSKNVFVLQIRRQIQIKYIYKCRFRIKPFLSNSHRQE
jgi:hypothetical protein